MFSFTSSYTAEVEPKHHPSAEAEGSSDAVNYFVLHGPAAQRVWMANQARFEKRAAIGLFKNSF